MLRTLLWMAAARYRLRRYSPEQIRRYQLAHARAIVRYAKKHSRFYQSKYRGLNASDFFSLPFVDKNLMMEDIGSYATIGATSREIMEFCLQVEKSRDFGRRLRGHMVAMSTGTSGSRGVEIVSQGEESFLRATFLGRFPFPRGVKANIAFILRVSSPALNLHAFGHRLTYVSQLEVLESVVAKLNRLTPNVISGPPSFLRLLAEEQERGALNISPLIAVSYGEVLYPDVRAHIEAAFHCGMREIYKCTEGAIAMSCAFGSLHINEDLVLVELFDQDGTPAAEGSPCDRMVITDLHRRSQPMIRYQLNDLITISPSRCRCGSAFRVIASVQGRRDEMFWVPRTLEAGNPGAEGARRRGHFVYPDYVTRAIVSACEPGSAADPLREYVAVQESPHKVVVYLEPKSGSLSDGLAESVRANLTRLFAAFDGVVPRIDIQRGLPNPLSERRKHSRVVRQFKVEEWLQ